MSLSHRGLKRARVFACLTCVLVPFASVAGDAPASQKWPEKTVRIVTPFAPGGGTDVFARLLAQHLTETYAQQFVVENRPGAGLDAGHGARGESARGRLHVPDDVRLLFVQPGTLPEAAVRSGEGLRCRLAGRARAACHRGPSFFSGVESLRSSSASRGRGRATCSMRRRVQAARCIWRARCSASSRSRSSRTCLTRAAAPP